MQQASKRRRKRRRLVCVGDYISMNDLQPVIGRKNVLVDVERAKIAKKISRSGEAHTYWNFTYNKEYTFHLDFEAMEQSMSPTSSTGRKKLTKEWQII